MGVLYHVSIADRHKEQFAMTDCIATAMQLLLGSQDVNPVLLALCVNLACCSKNAEIICSNNGLKLLMKRLLALLTACCHAVFSPSLPFLSEYQREAVYTFTPGAVKTTDAVLFKMIRNLSDHADIKMLFLPFVDGLAHVVTSCNNDAVLVEVVGILANLTIPDVCFLAFR